MTAKRTDRTGRLLRAGLAVAIACGGASSSPVVPAPPAQDAGPTGTVDLSIRGIGTEGFDSVRLDLAVTVHVDGLAVNVVPRQKTLDLASASPALIASFSVPASASSIHVSIDPAPAGAWKTSTGSGPIDARGLPISVDTQAAALLRRGAVEIRLDVGSSLQASGDGSLALLPDFGIYF